MPITPSKLRANIYKVLDQVAETGVPVEILRNGIILKIVVEKKPSKLARLKRRDIWVGDPDDIFKIDLMKDHMKEWREEWGIPE